MLADARAARSAKPVCCWGFRPSPGRDSSGWQLGRSVSNLQFERWEEVFGEPLATLRSRHGLPAEGVTTHGR
jgi:hypothetical protein